MTRYVAGFLFDDCRQHVVLIRKNRPEWQRGKLNGLGGRIEPGETPASAMRREFQEETGVDIPDWKEFAVLTGTGFVVHFFYGCADWETIGRVSSLTDELVRTYQLNELGSLPTVPNAKWLIPKALPMEHDRAASFLIQEIAA